MEERKERVGGGKEEEERGQNQRLGRGEEA